MNSFDFPSQDLFDQAGTWNDHDDPSLDIDLFLEQQVSLHLPECTLRHLSAEECWYCNLQPGVYQEQATPRQASRQYDSYGAASSSSSSFPLANASASYQASAAWPQQYPSMPTTQSNRAARTQPDPSRQYTVAAAALAQQPRSGASPGMLYGTNGASSYYPSQAAWQAPNQVQPLYYAASNAAPQPNTRSSGRISRPIPVQGQPHAGAHQQQQRQHQQRGTAQRLSTRTTPQPFLHSQLSGGLLLRTDHQARPTNGGPHDVASWNDQPRVAGDRSTMPTTTTRHLHPTGQSSPISEHSSSGASRRRDAAQMCQLAGSNQHRCTHPGCGKTYPSAGELTKHVRRCHCDPRDRPHACPIPGCAQRFNFPREVRRHIAARHEDANHYFCPHDSCPYAATGFSRSDHLDRHLKTKHRVGSAGASVAMSRTSSSSRTY